MMLLTFVRFALTRFDVAATAPLEASPTHTNPDDLTWFGLDLDRREPDRSDDDELARLSLTTPEADANSDFERWM